MRFHVLVGILPHEQAVAQPLEIDLTVRCRAPLEHVVDYRALYAVVSEAASARALRYLETIGQQIVAGALALPGVVSARVAVRKPHVSLDGPLAFAEIVIEGTNG